jgi:hypothetical protein
VLAFQRFQERFVFVCVEWQAVQVLLGLFDLCDAVLDRLNFLLARILVEVSANKAAVSSLNSYLLK